MFSEVGGSNEQAQGDAELFAQIDARVRFSCGTFPGISLEEITSQGDRLLPVMLEKLMDPDPETAQMWHYPAVREIADTIGIPFEIPEDVSDASEVQAYIQQWGIDNGYLQPPRKDGE